MFLGLSGRYWVSGPETATQVVFTCWGAEAIPLACVEMGEDKLRREVAATPDFYYTVEHTYDQGRRNVGFSESHMA